MELICSRAFNYYFLYVKNKGLYLFLPYTLLLMTLPLFPFLFCLLLYFNAQSRQTNNTYSLLQPKNQHATTPDGKVFSTVEIEAKFVGGTPEWITYLKKNLKANTP